MHYECLSDNSPCSPTWYQSQTRPNHDGSHSSILAKAVLTFRLATDVLPLLDCPDLISQHHSLCTWWPSYWLVKNHSKQVQKILKQSRKDNHQKDVFIKMEKVLSMGGPIVWTLCLLWYWRSSTTCCIWNTLAFSSAPFRSIWQKISACHPPVQSCLVFSHPRLPLTLLLLGLDMLFSRTLRFTPIQNHQSFLTSYYWGTSSHHWHVIHWSRAPTVLWIVQHYWCTICCLLTLSRWSQDTRYHQFRQ